MKGLRGEANAVAIQDNGRIVVAGTLSKPHGDKTYYNIIVARYNIHGNVDSGFGNNGSVTINNGAVDYCKAVAIQPDGKIVLAGTTYKRGFNAFTKALLVRLNKDGSYDTNFGDGGKVMALPDKSGFFIDANSTIRAIALQTDGKILIGGDGADINLTDVLYTVLMRFKKNGEIDKSFGNEGRADFYGPNIYDIAVQTDGKIMCAGSTEHIYFQNNNYYDVDDPSVVRYTTGGFIDTTYKPYNIYSDPVNQYAKSCCIALLPNDESVISLQSFSGESDTTLAVLKVNANGVRDSSFAINGGKTFTNKYLHPNTTSPSAPILVQPDGKIIVGCTYDSTGFFIARLLGSNTENKNIYSVAQAAKNININKNKFSVYPNPAKTFTTVSFNGEGNYVLKINDASGNLLQTKNIAATKALNNVTINISSYTSGMYFITLIDDKKHVQTLMFNKQ